MMSNDSNLTSIGFTIRDSSCVDWFNFDSMGERYKKFHGHIALVVCIFGTVANLLNVIVLTRKEMSTPINRMLTALAIADMLVMVEYIPFALHNYVLSRPDEAIYSYSWAVFVLFHANFSQIFHTISIQLTLTMAVWRYVAIKGSNRSASYCTFTRCNLCILFSYVFPIFLCIPHYFMFVINATKEVVYNRPLGFTTTDEHDNGMLDDVVKIFCQNTQNTSVCTVKEVIIRYHVGLSSLAKYKNALLYRIYFWTHSVVFKLIPCFVLTFFMCWLVNTLYKARKHHKMLEGKSTGYQLTTLNNEAQSVHPDRESGGDEGGGPSLPRRKGSSHVKIGEPKHSLENHNNHLGEDVGKHGEGKKGLLTAPAALTTADTTDTESRRVSDVSSCVSPMTEGRACDNNENSSLHPNQGLLRRGSSDKSPGGSRKGNGSTRRSKGFMRFPSIRRSSGQSDSRGGSRGLSGAKNSRRTDRTSKMLIAVLVLFLLTELPQGIMALLTGTYGQDFLRDCYNKWAEVWDTLALINGAINFILYCFMSKQFRLQFRLIFRLNRYFNKPKWISITTCNHNATISTTV